MNDLQNKNGKIIMDNTFTTMEVRGHYIALKNEHVVLRRF